MIPGVSRRSRRGKGRAGNSMLEFAIGWFIITTLFTATFQYGYTFYQYNALFNAVRGAAIYASVYPYDSSSATPSTNYSTNVKNVAVYGNYSGTGSALLTNLGTSNIVITMGGIGDSSAGTWAPVSVTVNITGYSINSVFGSFTASGKPKFTMPYTGVYQPY